MVLKILSFFFGFIYFATKGSLYHLVDSVDEERQIRNQNLGCDLDSYFIFCKKKSEFGMWSLCKMAVHIQNRSEERRVGKEC